MFTLPPRSQSQPLEFAEPPDYLLDVNTGPSPATSPGLSMSMSTLQVPNRAPLSPMRKFHLPSGAPVGPQPRLSFSDSSAARVDDLYEPGTPTSSTFPKFASPSQASSVKGRDDRDTHVDNLSDSAVSSLRWARDKDLASITTEIGKEFDEHCLSSAGLDRNCECRRMK
jgi:hypothetical protein